MSDYKAILFHASQSPKAQQAYQQLVQEYGNAKPEQADLIVALGGDGFMLDTVRQYMKSNLPIYGMNRGRIGFLMNRYAKKGLLERLAQTIPTRINPLKMTGHDIHDQPFEELAINEVSLLRQTHQCVKTRIYIDGNLRLSELVSDGVLVATPAGSTAYNYSAHGPILPLDAKILALTPISAFRPRHWRGALLPHNTHVSFEILNPKHRKVSATADNLEHRTVRLVHICEDTSLSVTLLFDQDHGLNERIIREQFAH